MEMSLSVSLKILNIHQKTEVGVTRENVEAMELVVFLPLCS